MQNPTPFGKGNTETVTIGWPRPAVDRSHRAPRPDHSAADRCGFRKVTCVGLSRSAPQSGRDLPLPQRRQHGRRPPDREARGMPAPRTPFPEAACRVAARPRPWSRRRRLQNRTSMRPSRVPRSLGFTGPCTSGDWMMNGECVVAKRIGSTWTRRKTPSTRRSTVRGSIGNPCGIRRPDPRVGPFRPGRPFPPAHPAERLRRGL